MLGSAAVIVSETGEELTPEDSAVFASAREEHYDEEFVSSGVKEDQK